MNDPPRRGFCECLSPGECCAAGERFCRLSTDEPAAAVHAGVIRDRLAVSLEIVEEAATD